MAVGTGFGQLFRGIGQVGGVGIASSIFQSILDRELRARIDRPGPEAEDLVRRIRHSSKLVATLPPDLQRVARDSYAISLRAVFIYAAVSTFLAFCVRLPVRDFLYVYVGFMEDFYANCSSLSPRHCIATPTPMNSQPHPKLNPKHSCSPREENKVH